MWKAMGFPWLGKQAVLLTTLIALVALAALAALAAGLSAYAGSEAASAGPTDQDLQRPAFTVPFEQPDPPLEQSFGKSSAGAQGGSPSLASSVVAEAGGAARSSLVAGPPKALPEQGDADAVQQQTEGEQTEYTWADGDRTLTVTLQADLVLEERTGDALTGALATTPNGNVVRSANSRGRNTGLPVFRSSSDALMTLPGGVLLLLDEDWSEAQVKRFLADNAISRSDVSELGWIDNGYFIETAAGFPSLRLANALAGQEGAEISSPNWWQQVELK